MAELVEVEGRNLGSGGTRLVQIGQGNSGQILALLRQFGVLVGIAAAVALGAWVVLWSQTPNYSLLYGNLSDRDLTQVMDALQGSGLEYQVDHASGAILVPSSRVHDARMKLAAAGLPKSASMGFEVLSEQSGFGTSQFMETVRYQHALEAELARTISQVSNVRTARVHLAMPKQTAFLRDRKPPSASVLVDLYPGRQLEKGQVAAISHLVAAAVPNLPISGVTVVDQQGSLLSEDGSDGALGVTTRQLDYTRSIEDRHREAITQLLEQIAGPNSVHVQVAAEMDYTVSEQTSETYNPDLNTLRSEQVLEEKRLGAAAAGIPGALSNQPPTQSSTPETTAAAGGTATDPAAASSSESKTPESTRTQQTRNYEVDRTISHITTPVGQLRRLSVAVLVNNRVTRDAQGVATPQPWTDEEIARFTSLAREAIGFSEARGDTISVTTADLVGPAAMEPLPEPPMWEQPWVWDLGRQLAGGVFALLVLFGVVRPAIKSLLPSKDALPAPAAAGGTLAQLGGQEGALTILRLPDGRSITVDLSNVGDQVITPVRGGDADVVVQSRSGESADSAQAEQQALPAPKSELEQDLERVQKLVADDPKLAALIIRGWVEAE